MTSTINPEAVARREAARVGGKFGTQAHSAPDSDVLGGASSDTESAGRTDYRSIILEQAGLDGFDADEVAEMMDFDDDVHPIERIEPWLAMGGADLPECTDAATGWGDVRCEHHGQVRHYAVGTLDRGEAEGIDRAVAIAERFSDARLEMENAAWVDRRTPSSFTCGNAVRARLHKSTLSTGPGIASSQPFQLEFVGDDPGTAHMIAHTSANGVQFTAHNPDDKLSVTTARGGNLRAVLDGRANHAATLDCNPADLWSEPTRSTNTRRIREERTVAVLAAQRDAALRSGRAEDRAAFAASRDAVLNSTTIPAPSIKRMGAAFDGDWLLDRG